MSGAPETVLKKRKTLEVLREDRAAKLRAEREVRRSSRIESFRRAEKYVAEYKRKEKAVVAAKRAARTHKNIFVPDEPRVAFVIRIRGINAVAPGPKKTLQLLRLRQIYNGVFVKINKPMLQMLRKVEPYIAWGYASESTIRTLVYKRGFGCVERTRTAIRDNALIEQHLGKVGIICMEDLVHVLVTGGTGFKEAARFLWPFKLSPPKGGLRAKRKHFVEGGDAGNREEHINKLIKAMC
jgi:large subunit ribosomal protein L7e